MKQLARRSLALFVAFILTISLMPATHHTAHAAGTGAEYVYSDEGYIYNWGTRGETATFLSPNAEAFYADNNAAYDMLSVLSGGTTATNSPGTDLYIELYELMSKNHKYSSSYDTEYGKTRYWYQYTDCQNSGKDTTAISSFYSGLAIGPKWDSGVTWNREHTWPNSKDAIGGKTIREADIMMLRPASVSENGSRSNKAYGESAGFYHPNTESNGAFDVRGDVARIALYIYVRWGGDNANANGALERMWGFDGVIESLDVLLTWMEEDPVDTWELGRNDSVQSITGTRNVFVDYPELAFLLFGATIPTNMITPSGEAAGATSCQHIFATGEMIPATCTSDGYTVYICNLCGLSYKGDKTLATGHNYENGKCSACHEAEPVELVVVSAPIVGTAYKFGMIQKNVSTSNVYYLTGAMSGYYMATTTDETAALDVYLEETVGGYYLYTMNSGVKTYINMVVSGSYVNGAYQAAASTVYTFDAASKTLIAQVNGSDYWYGTRNDKNYTTVGPCATSYNGFYCQFYGEPAADPNPDCQHTDTTVADAIDATCTEAGHTGKTVCAACGKVLSESEAIPALGHNYENGTCTRCGEKESAVSSDVTVAVSISDYAAANGWSNSIQYKELKMDDTVTVKVSGSTNTGKYYTSGYNWRIYQTENPSVVISAGDKTILSVKITYASEKGGVLTLNGSKVTSGTVVDVNASSVNFGVGNTGTATNGQVRITAIEVVYAGNAAEPEVPVCQHADTAVAGVIDATCNEEGHTGKTVCAACGEILSEGEVIPALGHNYENGTCTRCGEKDPSVSTEVAVTVSIRDYAAANGWSNSIQYKELKMDDTVTVNVSGSTNTGKYYTSGYNWRIYQTEKPSVVISAGDKTILSVKITYASEKGGVLTLNGSKVTSGTVVDVNASSVNFGVGNTGTATNGQVRITAIEVVYAGNAAEPEVPVCQHADTAVAGVIDATCNEEGHTGKTVCAACGEILSEGEVIPALGHNYENGTCTHCGEKEPAVGSEVTVAVSISDYAAANGWSNSIQYKELKMDDTVTVKVFGSTNTGKYYTSGYNWRIYQTEKPSVVISAGDKTVLSVKITYASEKGGVLTLNGSKVTSGTVVDVNASSVNFGVGNTGSATNGQVRITAIEVVYAGGAVEPETHTVTFVGLNGEVLDTVIVKYSEDATAPEAPIVEGYNFLGWDAEFVNITEDLTVTALYELKTYTVKFILPAGGAEYQTVKHGETMANWADFVPKTNPEYTFLYWKYETGGEKGAKFDFSAPVTGDVVLRASQGYSIADREVALTTTYGDEIFDLGTATLKNSRHPNAYSIGQNIVTAPSFAGWDNFVMPECPSITIDGITYTYGEKSSANYYVFNVDTVVVEKDPSVTKGYMFASEVVIELYHRVTFYLPTGGNTKLYVKHGDLLEEFIPKAAAGECFLYWYNSKGGAKLDYSKPVTGSMAFSAKCKWVIEDHDVTLMGVLNGKNYNLGMAVFKDSYHARKYSNKWLTASQYDPAKIILPDTLNDITVDGVTYTYGSGSNYYTVEFNALDSHMEKGYSYRYYGDVVLYHKLVTVYTTVNGQRTGRVTLRNVEHGTVLTRELLGLSQGQFIAEETVITSGGTIYVELGEHADRFACRDAGTLAMVGVDDGVYTYECTHCGRNFRSEDGTQAG